MHVGYDKAIVITISIEIKPAINKIMFLFQIDATAWNNMKHKGTYYGM